MPRARLELARLSTMASKTIVAAITPPGQIKLGTPNRIRTGVAAVKGRCPGPLDDGCLIENNYR